MFSKPIKLCFMIYLMTKT